MGWLRFGLELEDELAVETAVRAIRSNYDPVALRTLAEQCYRAWVQQTDITRQLLDQLAAAEQKLAKHEPINPQFLEWAQEITQQLGVEQPDAEPLPARRSWFRRLWPSGRRGHQTPRA